MLALMRLNMVKDWNDKEQVMAECMRLARPGLAVVKYSDRENYNIIFASNAEKAKARGAEIVLTV